MIKNIMDNLEHVPPAVLKKILSGCLWEGEPASGVLALTFDDGPDPEITPAVLDVLDEVNARGTFFLTGKNVLKHPGIARMISERGHTLGNHSMTHRKMLMMKKKDVETEIDDTQKAVSDAAGIEPMFFRPPYGIFDFTCSGVVKDRGLSMVLWTVLSGDYSDDSPETILKTVHPFIRPGAIQVFHDTSGGGNMNLCGIIREIGSIAERNNIRLGTVGELTDSNSIERNKEK
ncbi:polysaccharide deacetylase family protein [Candidatus Latescibacterota bacterium]